MNDLYLIGNGFDLAHGLETSYNHFLLWYLNDFLRQLWDKEEFDDKLMNIKCINRRYRVPSDFRSVSELLNWLEGYNYKITTHDFFDKIIRNYRDKRWVDIEYEYYMALVEIYRSLEKSDVIRSDFHFNQVKPLNDCFESIKKKLVEYLGEHIKIKFEYKNYQMEDVLFDGVFNEKGIRSEKEMLFVCFNYTQTMGIYLNNSILEKDVIYIHGKLNGSSNPVIFGYGDEMDPHYEKVENLNNNEFLKNIKSFNYFKTDNYQKVIRFIEGEGSEFTVKILGHSCGLSDRILLNTIFEHPNCKNIKIFHYEKSPTENDYFEKTQEISRHFKASKKGEMRMKIVPFDRYSAIPQNPKEN